MNASQSLAIDRGRPLQARDLQAVRYVLLRFRRAQRVQVKTRNDALCQLLEFGLGQHDFLD